MRQSLLFVAQSLASDKTLLLRKYLESVYDVFFWERPFSHDLAKVLEQNISEEDTSLPMVDETDISGNFKALFTTNPYGLDAPRTENPHTPMIYIPYTWNPTVNQDLLGARPAFDVFRWVVAESSWHAHHLKKMSLQPKYSMWGIPTYSFSTLRSLPTK